MKLYLYTKREIMFLLLTLILKYNLLLTFQLSQHSDILNMQNKIKNLPPGQNTWL